jgi:exodeoxyribonuclease VII large subunit
MKNKAQSQWDFGELVPPAETRKIHSVSDITGRIKKLLNREVGEVWVSGEITNFRAQSSGHCYFTLKDAGAQISCALFRGQRITHRESLGDGQKVLLRGDVTVYEARGQYQMIVSEIELQGVGALQLEFERLKRKLQDEGLFESDRKRPLPEYPESIGLITSPTGAAIRDVQHVIERRNPSLEVLLVPVRVQGDGAAGEIARAIQRLNQFAAAGKRPELILITRGGGSLEDLWAFNEEVVARAIAASALPVVSAVGHEIDFSIADFVADLRAATPSAAAEILTEGIFSNRDFITHLPERLASLVGRGIRLRCEALDRISHRLRLRHPLRRIQEHQQRLDDYWDELKSAARSALRARRDRLDALRRPLSPYPLRQNVEIRRQRLGQLGNRARMAAQARLRECQARLSGLEARLKLLSPQNVLNRGYSVTRDANTGAILRNAMEVPAGSHIRTTLKSGELTSTTVAASE